MKHSSILEVRDVHVRFGGLTALDAVSLTVEPGQVVGVIGVGVMMAMMGQRGKDCDQETWGHAPRTLP